MDPWSGRSIQRYPFGSPLVRPHHIIRADASARVLR
jgi:hypothetical protein